MVQQVAVDRMLAIPVVGRVADPVRNRRKDQRAGQDQVVGQDQGADPLPGLGLEAGVTADIS